MVLRAALIRAEVSDMAFEAWFRRHPGPPPWQDGELYVRARDDFQVRMLDERYQSLCQAALRRSYGQPVRLRMLSPGQEAPAFAQPKAAQAPTQPALPAEPPLYLRQLRGGLLQPLWPTRPPSPWPKARATAYNPLFLYSGWALAKPT